MVPRAAQHKAGQKREMMTWQSEPNLRLATSGWRATAIRCELDQAECREEHRDQEELGDRRPDQRDSAARPVVAGTAVSDPAHRLPLSNLTTFDHKRACRKFLLDAWS